MDGVSVLMPVYNASRYPAGWLERAIESVKGAELCIGDDASTDGYVFPSHAKVARVEKNTGGAEAVNAAANMASGKYFILLSCRSWYEAGALESMATYLDDHPNIGFVYGNSKFYADSEVIRDKIPGVFFKHKFRKLFNSSFGYLYRREAFDAGCRYDCSVWLEEEQQYLTIADYDFVMQLIYKMNYTGYWMNKTILHYNKGGIPQNNDLLKKYRERIHAEFESRWSMYG